jgi:hypothetical protein
MKNRAFVRRFVEVCGTSEPAEVQRLLNVSYQAAKNYLNGRLPTPELLITIAEIRPYSIHWLLTGQGKKFAEDRLNEGAPQVSGQFEQMVRQICQSVVREMADELFSAARSARVMDSKRMEETVDEAVLSHRR